MFPEARWTSAGYSLNEVEVDEHKRLAAIDLAERLIGIDPTEDAYLDLCYPYDSRHIAQRMAARQSACALVAAGYLRCLGLRDSNLSGPYYGRNNAVSRLVQLGVDHGALSRRELPDIGDIVIIGSGLGTHALVSLGDYLENGCAWLKSVDGGRRAVREARRRIKHLNTGPALHDSALGTRLVEYRINISLLPFTAELVIPRP